MTTSSEPKTLASIIAVVLDLSDEVNCCALILLTKSDQSIPVEIYPSVSVMKSECHPLEPNSEIIAFISVKDALGSL